MTDIPKNSREIIRVTRADFKGHDMINVRVFFDVGEGEMKPGKQGVAFRAALLPEVLNALASHVAQEEVS
ncbi:transcriptional coactivator p15/PC4 family protein [Octadecabacter antarcticus]|uniref:transcriptional coactivator p15/PC4 family protein n=1 Tax=Octadecabacter antarcticus TaxID=1217908 RepID=UPI000318121C|nr:transcriptional coactivator p15/PC4 family protein [Octadecabacter antarcticus]